MFWNSNRYWICYLKIWNFKIKIDAYNTLFSNISFFQKTYFLRSESMNTVQEKTFWLKLGFF
jgi:hypothetical protein